MEKKNFSAATLCVQGGWQPTKGEPRVLPIYQSTTFKYDTSEQMARLFDLEDTGYFYTRLQNPTNDAVAAKIAALEGGVGAMLTSSGQAANFYAIFNICQAGDHFVCASTIYGGTFNRNRAILPQGSNIAYHRPRSCSIYDFYLRRTSHRKDHVQAFGRQDQPSDRFSRCICGSNGSPCITESRSRSRSYKLLAYARDGTKRCRRYRYCSSSRCIHGNLWSIIGG